MKGNVVATDELRRILNAMEAINQAAGAMLTTLRDVEELLKQNHGLVKSAREMLDSVRDGGSGQ